MAALRMAFATPTATPTSAATGVTGLLTEVGHLTVAWNNRLMAALPLTAGPPTEATETATETEMATEMVTETETEMVIRASTCPAT